MFATMKKKERVLMFFLFAAFVSAASALVADLVSISSQAPEGVSKIGTLERFGDDVKRKSYGEVAFNNTEKIETLYQKDTIFIGPGSKAKFDLPEYGGEFMLEPNSIVLVVLDFEKKSEQNANDKSGPKTEDMASSPRLRLKLLQGKISFKKKERMPSEASASSKSIVVEVADKTIINLDTQEKISFEKKEAGEFKVTEATHPVMASVNTGKEDESVVAQSVSLTMNTEFSENELKKVVQEAALEKPENAVVQAQEPKNHTPDKIVPAQPVVVIAKKIEKKNTIRLTASEVVSAEPAKAEPVLLSPLQTKTPKNSGLHVGPFSYEVVGLEAKDGAGLSAAITSNFVLGLGVGYGFDLSETLIFSLDAKVKRYQFASYPSVTIQGNNPTTSAIAFSLEKEVNDKVALSASLGVNEILSLEPKAGTELSLKQLLSPVVSIGASYAFGDSTKVLSGFEIVANVDALLPAKGDGYSTKMGHREVLKFLTVKSSDTSRVSAGFTAYQQKFSTPFSEITQAGFGFEISIGLSPATKKRGMNDLPESSGAR